jgi:hypothetical protein
LAVLSDEPMKIARRVKNKVIGRKMIRKVWKFLFKKGELKRW